MWWPQLASLPDEFRLVAPDLRGYGQSPVPSFVCSGTADAWSTPEVTREVVEHLRRPSSLTLPDVGHLPNLEAAARFESELSDFLRAAWESRA